VGKTPRRSGPRCVSSSSRHLRLMHVRVRLHLVHAVVALGRVAVALLVTVRGALMRLHIQRLTVAVEGLRDLFRGRGFEACGMAVDRSSVRCVGAGASVVN
jgi:hypothetical protein